MLRGSARSMAEAQEAGASQAWPGGTTHKECERMVENALLRNPTVKFMVEKMEEVWHQPGAALHVVYHCASRSVTRCMSPCRQGAVSAGGSSVWRTAACRLAAASDRQTGCAAGSIALPPCQQCTCSHCELPHSTACRTAGTSSSWQPSRGAAVPVCSPCTRLVGPSAPASWPRSGAAGRAGGHLPQPPQQPGGGGARADARAGARVRPLPRP